MRPIVAVLLLLAAGSPVAALDPSGGLDVYLPEGIAYDPGVPRPEAVLGHPVGRWHVRHDQLVRYFEALDQASERVALEVQGYSHEGRKLLLAVVTSPANHARLAEILVARQGLHDPALPEPDSEGLPAVAYLGFSVHGNEASGSNASLVAAYHLAAGLGPEVEGLLDEVVVLLDPSLNPDGLARFAQWANMHRGAVAVADPEHRERHEPWPGGRTNHYWFDLNRDWLPLVHPESRARMATFHRWKPNVVGDYHEMGAEQTYFFQPGVPEREHPLKPAENVELTAALARYHAAALERLGELFFTEEVFDDFYPGKGSTYPDLNGAVGVLFEQAGPRGHLRETRNGTIGLARAVRNQVHTTLSLLEGTRALRPDLLRYQARFFREALAEAERDPVAAWVFASPRDAWRAARLVELLVAHGGRVHELAAPIEAGGRRFEPGAAFLVPAAQPQYRLLRALFETRTEFADSTFYDVSAWTLPLAYGLASAALDRDALRAALPGPALVAPPAPAAAFPTTEPEATYAYVFESAPFLAPRLLYGLLEGGLRVRLATRPFEAATDRGRVRFAPGALVLPAAGQEVPPAEVAARLRQAAAAAGVDVWALASGLTQGGVDLGSPRVPPLELPRPLLVVGPGVSGYEAGEVWHLLDGTFGIALPLVELDRLGALDLAEHTHVLLVDGDYEDVSDATRGALAGWIRCGGVLVATRGAARWAGERLWEEEEEEEEPPAGQAPAEGATTEAKASPEQGATASPEGAAPARVTYAEYDHDRARQLVSGAILAAELDLTHPLAFGYDEARLPVFREGTELLEASDNPYENVVRYAPQPLLAGYVSKENLDRLGGAAAATARRVGEGAVVRLADDPVFRGFWHGTSKLLLNAIFYAGAIESTEAPADW